MSQDALSSQLAKWVHQAASPSAQDRQEALKALETFKADGNNFGALLQILSASMIDDQVLLFALNALDYLVRFNLLLEDQKSLLKDRVVLLWLQQPRKFARDKLSGILVDMAVREWPQKWPVLMDQLLQVGDQARTCALLSELIDVVHFQSVDNPSWDSERKAELQSALVACKDLFIPLLTSAGSAHLPEAALLFSKLAPWYPMACAVFCSVLEAIVGDFTESKGIASASLMADVLESLQGRPVVDDLDYLELPTYFAARHLESLQHCLVQIMMNDRDYGAFRNVSCALLSLVSTWSKSLTSSAKRRLCRKVVDFCLQCLQLPYLLIMGSAFDCLESFVRQHDFDLAPHMDQLTLTLLGILHADSQTLFPKNAVDFDEAKEFSYGLKLLQSNACDLLRYLGTTPKAYALCLQLVHLIKSSNAHNGHPRALLLALDHALRECRNEAVLDLHLDGLLGDVYRGHQHDPGVLYDLFSTLMHYVIFHIRLTKSHPGQLVEIVFEYIETSAEHSTLDVRCRAFSALLKWALDEQTCQAVFHGPQVLRRIVGLGSHAHSQRELRSFVETVLTLALKYDPFRMDLLNCILGPVLHKVDTFSQNLPQLVKTSGLELLLQHRLDLPAWQACDAVRSNAVNVLTLVQTTVRRLVAFFHENNVETIARLRPMVERFLQVIMRTFDALVNAVQEDRRWHQSLRRQLFVDEFTAAEDDDDKDDVVGYANRWFGHLLQTVAMCLNYLHKCHPEPVVAQSGTLIALYGKILKASTRTVMLRNVFAALSIPDWTCFIQLLHQEVSKADMLHDTAMEPAIKAQLGEIVNWTEHLLMRQTDGQRQDPIIDVASLEIKGPTSESEEGAVIQNIVYWPNVAPLVFLLLDPSRSVHPTNRVKLVHLLHHHLPVLLRTFDGHLLVPSLISLLLCLLPFSDVQIPSLYLLVELGKWMLIASKADNLRAFLRERLPASADVDGFVRKLSHASVKNQRSEARQCFASLLHAAASKNPPKVQKLPEKLVILQKLQKKQQQLKDDSLLMESTSLSLLFDQ
jgi:hypothetical protein